MGPDKDEYQYRITDPGKQLTHDIVLLFSQESPELSACLNPLTA